MIRNRSPWYYTLAVIAVTAIAQVAQAKSDGVKDNRPYKGSFNFSTTAVEFLAPDTVLIVGDLSGNATFLGSFEGEARYVVNLNNGKFTGSYHKVAVDGTQIDGAIRGNLTPTGTVGTFQVVDGTGRAAHVRGGGSFTGTWTNLEATEAIVVFDASLDYHRTGNFKSDGTVAFSNIQAGLAPGGIVPYHGVGSGGQIGANEQTGTIRNLSGLIPIDATTFMFYGEVGPHPTLPGAPEIHLISTSKGDIHVTWTAVFTVQFINEQFDAVLSGDGTMAIIGGTGKYAGASGEFWTVFVTDPVPLGADAAVADFAQGGMIRRK